ncbi:MAG TPA: NDP-sugar synthase [Candidatus Binataceae bacterium]|nr:NDP-sugar synthase [Candidatus Binataceae bacterium]
MKTILFANREAHELAPLTGNTCAAMLRVAGKPLVVYAAEALAMARFGEVMVVVFPFAKQVEKALGNGARWGIHIEYFAAAAGDTPDEVIGWLAAWLGGEDYLVMSGEILRTPVVAEFVEQAMASGADSVAATIGGVLAGLRWVRGGTPGPLRLADNPADPGRAPETVRTIEMRNARLSLIESFASLHRANLEAAAGRFPGLIIPGRELTAGVTVGRKSIVPARSVKGTPVFVGSRCRIAPDAELMSDSVIASGVVIDRRATVRGSVVMPNTYVGELVEVANAIIAGNILIDIESGAVTRVTDAFLIANMRATSMTSALRVFAGQIAGLMLLIASLPLWPMAAIAALAESGSMRPRGRHLVGNRGAGLRAFEFQTSVPVLRYLPYLLAVAAGMLSLVGVDPLTPEQSAARRAGWEFVRDEAPVGLVGPASLTLSRDAPSTERRVVEFWYTRGRSFTVDLKWLGRAALALIRLRGFRGRAADAGLSNG